MEKKELKKIYQSKIDFYKPFSSYEFPKEKSVLLDIETKYGPPSELAKLFSSHKGNLVHKWHHYLNLYDRYFSSFKTKKNSILF